MPIEPNPRPAAAREPRGRARRWPASLLGGSTWAQGALAAAAAAAFAVTAAAQSEPSVLPAPIAFAESFVGGDAQLTMAFPSVQAMGGASGRLLTGLRLGEPAADARIDVARLRVTLPRTEGQRLCVDMTTMDNRYTAESAHPLDAGAGGAAALGLSSSYADALGAYRATDLLVFARRADVCDGATRGVLAPAVLVESGDQAGRLVVAINVGRGRPTAQLFQGETPIGDPVRCKRDEQAAKSHDCEIATDGLAPGVYRLEIVSASLAGGGLEESYDIALP